MNNISIDKEAVEKIRKDSQKINKKLNNLRENIGDLKEVTQGIADNVMLNYKEECSSILRITDILTQQMKELKDVVEISAEQQKKLRDNILNLIQPLLNSDNILFENTMTNNRLAHEILLNYGWFFTEEIPCEIQDNVLKYCDYPTEEQVNDIVKTYFNQNDYRNLKLLVNEWENSKYFVSRNHIFNEVIVGYSNECFNSVVSMLILHREGLIFEFVLECLGLFRKKTPAAIEEIMRVIEAKSYTDFKSYYYTLKDIKQSGEENYNPEKVEECSDSSRHKIAHGRVTNRETEENALRNFLYINQIYKAFKIIDFKINGENWET